MATPDWKTCLDAKFVGISHCAVAFCLQVPKCTDLNPTLLYILILGANSKFAYKHQMLVLGVCFQQTCLSAGRMFDASRSRLYYYQRIVSSPQLVPTNLMKCLVSWIPLRICVRLRKNQTQLKVSSGISRSNADFPSDYIPVYKEFHRIPSHWCGNETNRR